MGTVKCDETPKPKQKQVPKYVKTGEEMIAQPMFHIDESFWYAVLAYMVYHGDYAVLAFCIIKPALTYILCSVLSTPGKDHCRDNMVEIDLRAEYKTPDDLMNAIKGAEFTAKAEDRPNSEWVGYFDSSLRPAKMDHLTKEQMRIFGIKAQGKEYLPKASNTTLAMAVYSIVCIIFCFREFSLWDATKLIMMYGTMGNLSHILRDHSVSGLAHHAGHNVGEFDKWEFISSQLKKTIIANTLATFFDHTIFKLAAVLWSISNLQYLNHTLTHYNYMDIKGKGMGWKLLMDLQRLLASTKIVCSKQYHALHHYHSEMSYPAAFIVFNEYLNSHSLRPFLTRTMTGKTLNFIEWTAIRIPAFFFIGHVIASSKGTAWF